MTPRNESVTPAPFEAAEPAAPAPGGPAPDSGPRWVLPALALLALLAAAVVFWLPSQVGTQTVPAPGTDAAAPATPAAADAAQPRAAGPAPREEATPWSDAQLAKLRKEAQDALAELLDLQLMLEERSVEAWGAQGFAEATAAAAAGDELYRQREFEAATARYLEGRDRMQALLDSIPEVVEQELEAARQAIEAGDAGAASAALELAAMVEPENARLPGLQARAQKLPELVPLLQRAAEAEAGGDLEAAQQALQRAAALDPEHRRAAAELERVGAAWVTQQFNDAMSEGYAALDESRFDAARRSFRRAAALQEGSAEAAAALRETETAATAYRLASLKRSGAAHEADERWEQAVEAYEAAAAIDPDVLFARDGLVRSRERAALDRQFRRAIEEPLRLSDPAVAAEVETLLGEARQVSPRGPVLERQITRLEELLRQARTPIAVTLKSDMQTEVILYKVKRLGRFDQTRLSLRPGEYTAVGTRIGFRDVRKTFTLSHDSDPQPIVIACTEPI